MKHVSLFFGLLSLSITQVYAEDPSLKTIIKDAGDRERASVDTKKLCAEVMKEQQRLMTAIRPEFSQKVVLFESTTLEVFRSDNSVGYAAKCIFRFPSR